jgi:hypothetical protein
MISPALIAALLQTYAPAIPTRTAAAIISHESSGSSWAIGDNTAHRSHEPHSFREAVTLAHDLITRGHNIDIGLGQVNSVHIGQHGVTVEAMLHPGSNLVEAQAVYVGALALTHNERLAIAAYNGSGPAAERYADAVIAAEHSPFVEAVVHAGSYVAAAISTPAPTATTLFFSDGRR